VVIAPSPGAAAASPGAAAALSNALAVELLVVFCYRQLLAAGKLGAEAEQLASLILGHEEAHVHALEAELRQLGGSPPPAPGTVGQADNQLAARHASGSLSRVRTERGALDLLYDLEAIAVGAHYKALDKLSDPQLVRTSLEIMGVEAQHASAIGALIHPGKFEKIVPLSYVRGKA
jgi:rubrerythrin